MIRTTVNGELPRTHLKPGARGLCALQVHGLRVVLRSRIQAMAAGKTASMHEQGDQNNDKRKRSNGGTNGNSLRRIGVATSIRTVPNLANSNAPQGISIGATIGALAF